MGKISKGFIEGTSLHDSAHFEPLCVKIHPRIVSVDESVGK